MYEINRCIPDVLSVYYGNCIYVKERLDFKKDAETTDVAQQVEQAFLKKVDHQPQNEFRMLWTVKQNSVTKSILITCPEAVKYCERVDVKKL
jgi:hypothetical protein